MTNNNPAHAAPATPGPLDPILERVFTRIRQKIEAMPPEERKRREEDDRQAKEAERLRHIDERLRESGAPPRHLQTSPNFENAWGEKFREIAPEIGTGTIFALTGRENKGKTQMGVELLREVISSGNRGLFTTAAQMFADIKSAYTPADKQTERDQFAKYRRPKLLVIDALQRMAGSEWERKVLMEILEGRYGDKRDTILISDSTVVFS